MSDIFDKASDLEALHRELAINEIREKKKDPYSGYCLCCNEHIQQGRFCSAECREDWEMEQKIKLNIKSL
jgi:predicted nucleic acid-binding Zn ribbon protein